MIIQLLKADGDSSELITFSGKDQYVIGREEGDLVLGDERCSRKHALLFTNEQGLVSIRDLKSTNGIILNKDKVIEAALNPEDTFRLGRTSFIFFGCLSEESPGAPKVLREPVSLDDIAKQNAPQAKPASSLPPATNGRTGKSQVLKRDPKAGPLPEVMSSAIEQEALANLPPAEPLGSVLLNGWPDNFRALKQDNLVNFIEHLDEDQKKKSRRLVDYVNESEPDREDDAA